ncbi:serine/threonine-protein kinase [Streptomyces sp. NPDC091649]|uniref:serine/threonine-protein kinase n=1 Tax=Streptomyces sp. NPDC091649 TaxID=3366004 RepID=UPI00382D57B7
MTLSAEDPRTIGRYRLLSRLGAGGMGVVYLARSPSGRQVAVKVIQPDLAQDPGFRARFRREVEVARQVSGAFTAAVVDADCDTETPWLATLYIAGPTLAEHVAREGPLTETEVYRLAGGLAEALHDIHRTGLVHRDLKPGNILLADDGPRVIDFGIARIADATRLTSTGLVVGTPQFMAPEQFRRGEVSPATDVFSLGGVLTHAGSGHGPFDGDNSHAVGFRVVHEEPDLSGLPASLHSLVLNCLTKEPAARPTVAALLRTLPDVGPAAPPHSRPAVTHPPTEPSGAPSVAPGEQPHTRTRPVKATPPSAYAATDPAGPPASPLPPGAPPPMPSTPPEPPAAPVGSTSPVARPLRRRARRWTLVGLAAASVVAAATVAPRFVDSEEKAARQGGSTASPASPASTACPTSADAVVGSGVTVHKGLMNVWIQEFTRLCPDVAMTYQPLGHGAGVHELREGKAAFATVEKPLGPDEFDEVSRDCPSGEAGQIPLGAAPVAVIGNLPGLKDVALSPSALALIFKGSITRWNAPAIAETNPDVSLPDIPVRLFPLQQGTTTKAFTAYLAANAPQEWGAADRVTLPKGVPAQDGAGVVMAVAGTPGAVSILPGPFAAEHAGAHGLALATGRQPSVTATPQAVTRALSEAKVSGRGPADLALTHDPRSRRTGAYPVLQPVYAVVCEGGEDADALRASLTHSLSEDGRSTAADLGYGSLPDPLLKVARRTVGDLS